MKSIIVPIILSIITTLGVLVAVSYMVTEHPESLNSVVGTRFTNERVAAVIPTDATIPDVVEASTPAVVSIIITAEVPVIERFFDDVQSPFGGMFNFRVPRQRQIGTETQEIGGGTGFFVSADGYLVTNRHVVSQEGVEYSVMTNDGTVHDVTVVALDPALDVAILKVDADVEFPYLEFAGMSTVRLGEPVIAIGNALAEFPNSVSVGVVSGLSRNIVAGDGMAMSEALEGVLQTDAAINPGNSGGPLLNTAGQVVGVNVAVAGNSENIGFALPSNVVASVYESVRANGKIIRPFLGVQYTTVTPEVASEENLPVTYGALVIAGAGSSVPAVVADSPADAAGVQEGDVITAVGETSLRDGVSLATALRAYQVGDTVTLTLVRDGEEREVMVTFAAVPEV